MPNAATLALLAAGDVLIQVQVRLEEKHLSGLHGSDTGRTWLFCQTQILTGDSLYLQAKAQS